MKKGLFFVVLISFLFSVSYAIEPGGKQIQPKIPLAPVAPKTSPVKLPDVPQILEFSASPETVIEGDPTTFRWRVTPGPGGSPINKIQIIGGTPSHPIGSIYSRLVLSGEFLYPRVPAASSRPHSYTLIAANEAGKSSYRTIEVATVTMDSFKSKLSGFNLAMEFTGDPRRPGQHRFTAGFDNRGTLTVGGIQIYLIQAYSPVVTGGGVPDGNQAGILLGQTIRPGRNEYTFGGWINPTSAGADGRRMDKLVVLVAKGPSSGVIDTILMRAIYDLTETTVDGSPAFRIRLVSVE